MNLMDRLHSWTYLEDDGPFYNLKLHSKAWMAAKLDLRIALRKAHRFELDDDFVRQVVRRANVNSTKMLANVDLANLPYDAVFLEWDNNVRVDAQHDGGTGAPRDGEDRGRAGFLIERHRANNPARYRATYIGGFDDSQPDDFLIGGCAYWIDCEGTTTNWFAASDKKTIQTLTSVPKRDKDWLTEYSQRMELMLEGFGWGYGDFTGTMQDGSKFNPDHPTLGYMTTEALSHRGCGAPEPRFLPLIAASLTSTGPSSKRNEVNKKLADYFLNSSFEGRGDLRFIVTALAMINTVPIIYQHRQAKGYYRRRLRNIPYLDSTTLTIKCGTTKIVNVVDNAFKVAQSRHKRHEVRGFWRNVDFNTIPRRSCAHEPIERDGDYALCGKCQHLLKWIDHHERGDAALGFVKHDYTVTT